MVVSAVLFAPAERYTNPPLVEATVSALLGGLALLLAMYFSPYRINAAQAAEHAITGGRARWFLIVPGLFLLAFGTEISANVLKTERLPLLGPQIQCIALASGLALFAAGMIGVRRLSLPRLRIRWSEIFPVLGILVLAFAVRAYKVDTLVRLSVDEGHYMEGVYYFIPPDQTTTDLLTTPSGNLPATTLYSYWNLGTSLIWGRNLVGLRMADIILGTLTVLAAYGVGNALFDRRMGIIAALMLATFPLHVFYSRVSIGSIGDPFFGTLAIMLAARGFRWNRRTDWILMGVSLGMAQYFYEGGRLLFPVVFLCWTILIVLVLRKRIKPLRRGLLLAVISTIVVVTPMYFTMWYT
jgi:hypothetical protein